MVVSADCAHSRRYHELLQGSVRHLCGAALSGGAFSGAALSGGAAFSAVVVALSGAAFSAVVVVVAVHYLRRTMLQVPDISVVMHMFNGDFQRWLVCRGEFELADQIGAA